MRDTIRQLAEGSIDSFPVTTLLIREQLETQASNLLTHADLSLEYLGFTMVMLNNAFWAHRFSAIPFDRRLLLLPNCLRKQASCAGTFDSIGLHCAGCQSCDIADLLARAEALGYQTMVAEGTSSVLMHILEGKADALLGVACLDSLEKSFARVVEFGIPNIALPLLCDGCVETEIETEQLLTWLPRYAAGTEAGPRQHSYLPLLRATGAIFHPDTLTRLLRDGNIILVNNTPTTPLAATEQIAIDWLQHGGKRLRPFVTLAAYAGATLGTKIFDSSEQLDTLLPDSIKRIAMAIEALHKASLVHDDIEDGDAFRYGRPTLHRSYGLAPAINIGDYLVGLGYRLIAGETAAFGAECVADILQRLATAHLDLCRGQGAELLWQQQTDHPLQPLDVLSIYALKTAPAFEVALYAGLRSAGSIMNNAGICMQDSQAGRLCYDLTELRRFAMHLGEAYQIQNDLDDWERDDQNKQLLGQDVLAGRPTILRAFALQAAGEDCFNNLDKSADPALIVQQTCTLYQQLQAFSQARQLRDKLRQRAMQVAETFPDAAQRELLTFLVRMILPQSLQASV